MVNYMMIDNRLSEEERLELKALVKCIGLDAGSAMEACRSIGQEIYYDRLRAARSDGAISEEERRRLSTIRTIFQLKQEVPSVGTDWAQACAKLRASLDDSLQHNDTTLRKLLGICEEYEVQNESLSDLNEFIGLQGNLSDWLEETGDYQDEMKDYVGSDQQTWEDVKALESQVQDLVKRITEFRLQEKIKDLHQWAHLSAREIQKLNNKEWDERKTLNKRLVLAEGFVPAGSPKQKAWVYDIIAEQCIGTSCWEFITVKAHSSTPDSEAELCVRFLSWLKNRPCRWWIDRFQEGDLESAFQGFKSNTAGFS